MCLPSKATLKMWYFENYNAIMYVLRYIYTIFQYREKIDLKNVEKSYLKIDK